MQDDQKAVEFFTRSCNGGDALACRNLGVIYANNSELAFIKFPPELFISVAKISVVALFDNHLYFYSTDNNPHNNSYQYLKYILGLLQGFCQAKSCRYTMILQFR